jgi:nucleoside-diphosphate-sugar epimerase
MDRLLIIGGTGLLGNCIFNLLKNIYQIDCVSSKTGFDLCDPASFNNLKGPYSAIINCAAVISNSDEDTDRLFAVNALGALHVARYAQSISSRLIHVSTLSAINSPDNEYFNYYGVSKAAGDQLVSLYCACNQVPLTICRFSSLYDTKGLAVKNQPMLYRLIDQVENLEVVRIYGTLNPIRNYLHLEDAAGLISRVLSNHVTGMWNCVHPNNIDIESLIHLIGKVMNREPRIQYIHEKPNLLKIHIPEDQSIFKHLTDFIPRSLETGLKEIIEHAKV